MTDIRVSYKGELVKTSRIIIKENGSILCRINKPNGVVKWIWLNQNPTSPLNKFNMN